MPTTCAFEPHTSPFPPSGLVEAAVVKKRKNDLLQQTFWRKCVGGVVRIMMMHEIVVGSVDDNNDGVMEQRAISSSMEDDVIDEVYTDYCYVASAGTSNNNNNNNDNIDSNDENNNNDSINDATTTAPTKEMDTATATKSMQDEEDEQVQQEQQQEHEEECVICFETLSTMGWGRCTPCGHAFHKQCWWQWENVYNQRVDIRNLREGINNSRGRGGGGENDKCKCCLCNTINIQFIDGDGNPARNPTPYIAIDDDPSQHPSNSTMGGSSDGGGGGNRFTQFIRGMNEGANGFISFMRNESNWNSSTPGTGGGGVRGGGGGGSFRRMSSFLNNQHAGSSSSGGGGGGGRRQQQQQQHDLNPYNTLRPGTQVILQNLTRSSHLNKKRGTILQYQAQTLRYLIQLETDTTTSFIPSPTTYVNTTTLPIVSIKGENLLQPITVQIVNLRTQPYYNGKVGTITAYVRPIDRYVIKIEIFSLLSTSSREVSVQLCNIRIPNGTLVRLEGLEHASQWNGKYGTVARFVEGGLPRGGGGGGGGGGQGTTESVETGRYQVSLSRQYSVLVKVENVRI